MECQENWSDSSQASCSAEGIDQVGTAGNASGIGSGACSLAAEVSGLERQSPVVGGCRGRAGASSPELGQRGGLPSAAEPRRRLQVPLCLGGNTCEKHSVLKGKKIKLRLQLFWP